MTENWQGRGSVLKKAFNGRFSDPHKIDSNTYHPSHVSKLYLTDNLISEMRMYTFASRIKTDFDLSDSHHKNSFGPRLVTELLMTEKRSFDQICQ